MAQNDRVALFIDEVTYVIDVDSEFVGVLQKVWDRWLSDSNLMLALAGSQMGLMHCQHLLELRRTAVWPGYPDAAAAAVLTVQPGTTSPTIVSRSR